MLEVLGGKAPFLREAAHANENGHFARRALTSDGQRRARHFQKRALQLFGGQFGHPRRFFRDDDLCDWLAVFDEKRVSRLKRIQSSDEQNGVDEVAHEIRSRDGG